MWIPINVLGCHVHNFYWPLLNTTLIYLSIDINGLNGLMVSCLPDINEISAKLFEQKLKFIWAVAMRIFLYILWSLMSNRQRKKVSWIRFTYIYSIIYTHYLWTNHQKLKLQSICSKIFSNISNKQINFINV